MVSCKEVGEDLLSEKGPSDCEEDTVDLRFAVRSFDGLDFV